MISFNNVTFTYNNSDTPTLANVNIDIRKGEYVLVCGKSGSGKTSLCRAVNGLIPHFHGGVISGTISTGGLEPLSSSPAKMAMHVGMVFQDPENQLIASDVEHEICFAMENIGLPSEIIAQRLEELLELLNIKHLRHRTIHELSGGEKQLVAIASVLALQPDILMLDEPTSELDPGRVDNLFQLLKRLNQELGLTIIVVEHRLDKVIKFVNKVIAVDQGQILFDGPPDLAMTEYWEELDSLGVGLPSFVKLYHGFSHNEIGAISAPLTLEDSVKVFEDVFSKPLPFQPPSSNNNNNQPAIELDNVSFTYESGVEAVRNINLRVNQKEAVAILGCNASGKTTLVKLINGLLRPSSGTIKILGSDITDRTVADISGSVGVVFQNPGFHLFSETVEEEIAFALKLRGATEVEIAEKTTAVLERFKLTQYRSRNPQDLSSGEKQRLALASVIIYEPPILIIDEPDRGADGKTRRYLTEALHDYRALGNTVIMITHDVEMAARTAERVIIMEHGEITCDGNKYDVLPDEGEFTPQINRLIKHFEHNGVSSKLLTPEEVIAAFYGR